MARRHKIDFTKLLGFDLVSDHISATIDLCQDTIGAKLGAKVGDKVMAAGDLPRDPRANRI